MCTVCNCLYSTCEHVNHDHQADNTEEILGMSSLDLSSASQPKRLPGKFKKWLDPPDPSIHHNNARNKHLENTGQWLLKDERYLTWKEQPNSLMWINGICEHYI